MAPPPPPQRQLAHLTAPWIEDYVVNTLTALSSNDGDDDIHRPTIRPQVGQITQRPDQWGQTFVSDGQYMVLVRLPITSSPSTSTSSAETIDATTTIRPGQLYRLVEYEMILDDASDATIVQSSWNMTFRNATVFGREKKAVHLFVTSFHRVGGLLNYAEPKILMGDPRTLTHSVAIRRVLKSLPPRGDLFLRRRRNYNIDAVAAVEAIAVVPAAGPSTVPPPPPPLGNVAEAWQNKDMLAAIFDDDDDDPSDDNEEEEEATTTPAAAAHVNDDDDDDSPIALKGDGGGGAPAGRPHPQQWKSKTHQEEVVAENGDFGSADPKIFETQQQQQDDEEDDEEEEAHDEEEEGEESTNSHNMGIDAMLMADDEEDDEEERDVEDPPNLIRKKKEKALDDDDDQDNHGGEDDLLDDDEDDATPTIHNRQRRRRPTPPPPLRLQHHAGEFVRAWMSEGAAEQVACKKRQMEASLSQSPFSFEQRQYAGDGIRAWLHQSELMQHGGDLDC